MDMCIKCMYSRICVVQRVAVCVAVCFSVLQCDAVCCSVMQCVAVCCSVMQCVAAKTRDLVLKCMYCKRHLQDILMS